MLFLPLSGMLAYTLLLAEIVTICTAVDHCHSYKRDNEVVIDAAKQTRIE